MRHDQCIPLPQSLDSRSTAAAVCPLNCVDMLTRKDTSPPARVYRKCMHCCALDPPFSLEIVHRCDVVPVHTATMMTTSAHSTSLVWYDSLTLLELLRPSTVDCARTPTESNMIGGGRLGDGIRSRHPFATVCLIMMMALLGVGRGSVVSQLEDASSQAHVHVMRRQIGSGMDLVVNGVSGHTH